MTGKIFLKRYLEKTIILRLEDADMTRVGIGFVFYY